MIAVGGEALVDLVEEDGALRPVPGGGPFNTAIALGRLDVPVAFVGTLSTDDYGVVLSRLLGDAGVDLTLARRSAAPTPLAIARTRDGETAYTFYLAGTCFGDVPPEPVPELPEDVWALHIGTLALAVDPPAAAYGRLLEREAGRRAVFFDPNVRPAVFGDQDSYRARFEQIAQVADVVKLSGDDAAWLYPGLDVDAVCDRILDKGPRLVALTLGSGGASAASVDGRVRVAAPSIAVADTVGAGDSFGAALLATLVERGALGPGSTETLGPDLLHEAVGYAVTAAAITCTRTGAVPPTRAEIAAWTASARPSA